MDPWSGGGVLRSKTDKITIIIIPDAAHHLDLRAAHPNDPGSVQYARNRERIEIQNWLSKKDFYWLDAVNGRSIYDAWIFFFFFMELVN